MMQRLGKSPLNQTIAHFPSQLLCSLFPIQLRRLSSTKWDCFELALILETVDHPLVCIDQFQQTSSLYISVYQTQISGRNRVHITLFPLSDLLQIASNGTIVLLSHKFRKLAATYQTRFSKYEYRS